MDDFIQLKQDADLCVKCGLCVPVCPTWKVTKNEANSPRGRIMLIEAFARNKKVPQLAEKYLDACLDCGLCEQVCPSNVPYTRLITTARKHILPTPSLLSKFMQYLSMSKHQHIWFSLFTFIVNNGSLVINLIHKHLSQQIQLALKYLQIASNKSLEFPRINLQENIKEIVVFKGCFEEKLNQQELTAIKTLFNLCKIDIKYLHKQVCCGALHAHHGDHLIANNCLASNQQVFSKTAEFYTATSGCAQYINLDQKLKLKQIELGEYLLQEIKDKKNFASKTKQLVLIHLPCTQQRLTSKGNWLVNLLALIDNIEIKYLADNQTCCGAGGLSSIDHIDTSVKLAKLKIQQLKEYVNQNVVIISTNYSCRLLLQTAIDEEELNIKVLDPCSFLLSNLR